MRRLILALAAVVSLMSPALAVDSTVTALTAAGTLGGTELFYIVQGGADRKGTPAQIAAYVESVLNGDCTVNTTTNVITCTKSNGSTFGTAAFVNTGTSGAAIGLLNAANTWSAAQSFSSVTLSAITGSAQCLHVSTAGLVSGTGSDCGAGGGGTPGGTSGQVQFNSAGTFGGFTFSGDVTVNTGTGVASLKATGPGATGPIGSATTAPVVTIDAQGRVTGLTSATITQPAGATPTATAGPTAIAGSASTLMRSDGAPAIQQGSASVKGIVQVDGTTITATSGVISAVGGGSGVTSLIPGAGEVSSTAAACSQSTISTGGQTLSSAECVNAQVGTTYAIADGDRAKLVTGTNSASQAYTIAAAGASTTFQSGWFTRVQNKGTGPLTITPTTSTICGATTLVIYPGQTQKISSDGTNYQCDGGTTGTLGVSSQTGTNYPFVSANFGQLVNLSNAANQIPTIPQAGSAGFGAGWYVQACNQGAGTQTITPSTSTIGGASTFVLPAGTAALPKCAGVVSDGSNYQVVPDFTVGASSTIGSGTAALGTAAIASAACATAVTATATGVATTDVVQASFNGDPTAVTGYAPVTTGMLSIIPYPTANNVNFKVCNTTSASITPGAITLNWRVVR